MAAAAGIDTQNRGLHKILISLTVVTSVVMR